MTFEKLVRDEAFASPTVTTTVGTIGLERPTSVVVADAKVNREKTARLLADAHDRAVSAGAATILHQLALPFAGFESKQATDVKPDFAVIARDESGTGSWLIMGDAKDYERHRSKIDDGRLLKGFLQVAVGAESAAAWSQLPDAMRVHQYGVLAVPRNSFLQPEALVEDLSDHRHEVAMRIAERRVESVSHTFEPAQINVFIEHLQASFDPASCPSCSLFTYCRDELRRSSDPTDLLIEIGIPKDARPHLKGLFEPFGPVGAVKPSIKAQVAATIEGRAQTTLQRRVDPVGLPGTINLVLAKSDAAALGVHGIGLQTITAAGPSEWEFHSFSEPQAPQTRVAVMRLLGQALTTARKDRRKAHPESPEPIHLVVPDTMTADVLASIADNLAGLELSRLRWQRDKDLNRPALTFDGHPAQVPPRLPENARMAVSFLLEDDRARAMTLRTPVINAQQLFVRHHVVGGPAVNAGRLDYLVAWFLEGSDVDHRNLSDDIEHVAHTPGARLTNTRSNQIHATVSGPEGQRDIAGYETLVKDELEYKALILDKAIEILGRDESSRLRPVHRTVEADAQAVWSRRLQVHASDLVRFGRTYRWWRNQLVEPIQTDRTCHDQLLAFANPQAAQDLASDAGQRSVAYATVVSTAPLVLDVSSRRITAGKGVVLLHVNDSACVEAEGVDVKVQKGTFQIQNLSIGPLSRDGLNDDTPKRHLLWSPKEVPAVEVGDRLVLADAEWFDGTPRGRHVNIKRPSTDQVAAPRAECLESGYDDAPSEHQYCCKPHKMHEAEWSDLLDARRAAGELNPQVWPPVRSQDAFEEVAEGTPQGDPFSEPYASAPDHLTEDDID